MQGLVPYCFYDNWLFYWSFFSGCCKYIVKILRSAPINQLLCIKMFHFVFIMQKKQKNNLRDFWWSALKSHLNAWLYCIKVVINCCEKLQLCLHFLLAAYPRLKMTGPDTAWICSPTLNTTMMTSRTSTFLTEWSWTGTTCTHAQCFFSVISCCAMFGNGISPFKDRAPGPLRHGGLWGQ